MSNLVKGIDELSAVYRCGYQQGKADAIDELVRCFENRTEFRNMTRCECLNELRNLAYKLKEQTE